MCLKKLCLSFVNTVLLLGSLKEPTDDGKDACISIFLPLVITIGSYNLGDGEI